MLFRSKKSTETTLELAHDERLRRAEFERIDRVLEQFPVVREIVFFEEVNRARLQMDPPSPIDALCNTARSYPEVIPTLVELLASVRHPDVKNAIARALTVKEARGIANKALIETLQQTPWSAELEQERIQLDKAYLQAGAFENLPEPIQRRRRELAPWKELLFALGNAIAYVAQREDLPSLLELVRDPRYGPARTEVLRAVVRFRPAGLRELLLELLQEPDDLLALEAARGLARLKVKEAREAILARFAERMAMRGQGDFRKMVEKIVARLEG